MQLFHASILQAAFLNRVEKKRSMWDSYRLIFLKSLPLPATGNLIWGTDIPLVKHAPFSHLWEKGLISSLRRAGGPMKVGLCPAVPSSWLPDHVVSIRPLGPLGFLKLLAIPWNHKHYKSCHCSTFLHPSQSGSVWTMGQDLRGLSGCWGILPPSSWFFGVILLLFSYFILSYIQLGSMPNTF